MKATLYLGAAAGLAVSVATLLTTSYGLGSVWSTAGFNLALLLWPSSIGLLAGWASTSFGIAMTVIAVLVNCVLWMSAAILLRTACLRLWAAHRPEHSARGGVDSFACALAGEIMAAWAVFVIVSISDLERRIVDPNAGSQLWAERWAAPALTAAALAALSAIWWTHRDLVRTAAAGKPARVLRALSVGLGLGALAFACVLPLISKNLIAKSFYFFLPFHPSSQAFIVEAVLLVLVQPLISETIFRGTIQRGPAGQVGQFRTGVLGVLAFVASFPFLHPLAAISVATAAAVAYASADTLIAPVAANAAFMVLVQAFLLFRAAHSA